MPALVVALRPLPVSYQHVLQRFQRANRNLHQNNWSGFGLEGMNEAEKASLTSLSLTLGQSFHTSRQSPEEGLIDLDKFEKPDWFTEPFLAATNVTEVRISLGMLPGDDGTFPPKERLAFITEFPFWLQGFKNLKRLKVEIPIVLDVLNRRRREQNLNNLVDKIARKIGVRGRIGQSPVLLRGITAYEIWIWETRKENGMDWSEDLGMQWPDPILSAQSLIQAYVEGIEHADGGRTVVLRYQGRRFVRGPDRLYYPPHWRIVQKPYRSHT
ncbi:hypothetical protein EG329_000204 [Mollisiaceae sp. DMI_Dod_QoI]|nr:hypothetical protein EG329_000204 [Helotiales sp. DMI_Dod_QoI]